MNIQREESGGQGSFFIKEDGKQLALMTYKLAADNILVILHTEVDESLKGQSVGGKLVDAAVNYARENNLHIKPLCTFAKAVMDKKKELYADVLEQPNK